jgi:hypothetical protein
MPEHVEYDGVLRFDYFESPHEGKVHRRTSQPSADLILNRNAELRKNPGALRDLSFGRLVLNIPVNDLEMLERKYPELRSPDSTERTAAWARFTASAESAPYKVR